MQSDNSQPSGAPLPKESVHSATPVAVVPPPLPASHNTVNVFDPPPPRQAPVGVTPPPATGDSPAEAADEDLIEKAWVETAERLISELKNDPRAAQEAHSALSRDYLKKRFNIDSGQS